MSQQRPERPRSIQPPILPPPPSRRLVHYIFGLALGAIPLIVALLAFGGLASQISGSLLLLSIGLYVVALVSSIACLVSARSRFIGYGLLSMVFVIPIVAYIACVVSFRTHSYR